MNDEDESPEELCEMCQDLPAMENDNICLRCYKFTEPDPDVLYERRKDAELYGD